MLDGLIDLGGGVIPVLLIVIVLVLVVASAGARVDFSRLLGNKPGLTVNGSLALRRATAADTGAGGGRSVEARLVMAGARYKILENLDVLAGWARASVKSPGDGRIQSDASAGVVVCGTGC